MDLSAAEIDHDHFWKQSRLVQNFARTIVIVLFTIAIISLGLATGVRSFLGLSRSKDFFAWTIAIALFTIAIVSSFCSLP